MSLDIVRRIAYEKENSQIVSSKPRSERQRVRLNGLYELLILLRVILTLNLQTGWIHQDEYSNSLEVIAGDYFDLQVFKSPAFNSTFATQSMTLIHATIYLPYLLGNYILSYEHPVGKEQIPNSKLLILIPRLFHLIISFFIDYILIKFCQLNDTSRQAPSVDEELSNTSGFASTQQESSPQSQGSPTQNNAPDPSTTSGFTATSTTSSHGNDHTASAELPNNPSPPTDDVHGPNDLKKSQLNNDYSIRLVTLASSQVLLVFASRTHPSSINLLLFASLLYFVSASFHAFEQYIPLLETYNKIPKSDGLKRVHYLRLMKRTGYSSINRMPYIALITVIGMFNDPEFFISYGCIPLFFYMQRGISNRNFGMKYFHLRIFTFLTLFFTFCIPFVLWDSFYHGKVTLSDFRELNLSPESFVITPVNYFASKRSQFRDLWAYPKIFIQYILLFNVLGVMGLISFAKELYDIFFAEWRLKPNLDSHWTFLNCSLFLPLFFLIQGSGSSSSAFDLVPLIFPLVYMQGHKIPLVSRFNNKLGCIWFVSNLLGILFYGYASQGGITQSFLDLNHNLVPIRFNETQVDITFSQMTTIPPTFTLAIPSTWKTLVSPKQELVIDPNAEDGLPSSLHKTVLKLESSSKVRVYHTGHTPLPMSHLERDLHRLVVNQQNNKEKGEKISFLIIPHCYGRESESSFRLLKLTHLKTYWNHLHVDILNEDWLSGNGFNIGLSLYRMEKVVYSTSNKVANNTGLGQDFIEYFKFHDSFYEFVTTIVDFLTMVLTFGLFLTSFLVFLT